MEWGNKANTITSEKFLFIVKSQLIKYLKDCISSISRFDTSSEDGETEWYLYCFDSLLPRTLKETFSILRRSGLNNVPLKKIEDDIWQPFHDYLKYSCYGGDNWAITDRNNLVNAINRVTKIKYLWDTNTVREIYKLPS